MHSFELIVLMSQLISVQQFGDPLPGLTPAQLARFNTGKTQFMNEVTIQAGLGPIYNGTSCAECHTGVAVGGVTPNKTTIRFGQVMKNGNFNGLAQLGGTSFQAQAIDPRAQETIPKQANVTAIRTPTPLFGMGLINSIPDSTILAGVRSAPVNGVLGRANYGTKGVLGRFGWKAESATLADFAANAELNELGVTNAVYKLESYPNGNQSIVQTLNSSNGVPAIQDQPDAHKVTNVDRFTDFMAFLAPPPTQTPTASTIAGGQLFTRIGCAACHTPSMQTGTTTVKALSGVTANLYSDLLTHDMGSLNDGIAQNMCPPNYMRTAPLWGVTAAAPYLHDGRAQTLDAAIQAHDGEGQYSRGNYLQLTPDEQAQLIDFLNSI